MILQTLLRRAKTARGLKAHRRMEVERILLYSALRQGRVALATRFVNTRLSRAFHVAYYDMPNTWTKNSWFGTPIQQFPSDLLIYQEIMARRVPDFIVQTGVFDGGSALFLAHMLDLAGAPEPAQVVAVDIELRASARALNHPRIRLIEGDSTAPDIIAQIESHLAGIPFVNGGMVSLDSDHRARHVAKELDLYSHSGGRGYT